MQRAAHGRDGRGFCSEVLDRLGHELDHRHTVAVDQRAVEADAVAVEPFERGVGAELAEDREQPARCVVLALVTGDQPRAPDDERGVGNEFDAPLEAPLDAELEA